MCAKCHADDPDDCHWGVSGFPKLGVGLNHPLVDGFSIIDEDQLIGVPSFLETPKNGYKGMFIYLI